jgi:hypothetical protein
MHAYVGSRMYIHYTNTRCYSLCKALFTNHTCLHTCIHTYEFPKLQTRTKTSGHALKGTCIYRLPLPQIHAYTSIHMHIPNVICIPASSSIQIVSTQKGEDCPFYTYTHVYTCRTTYVHRYIHIHTHTHACMLPVQYK